jgi:hypothetical protein
MLLLLLLLLRAGCAAPAASRSSLHARAACGHKVTTGSVPTI